MGIILLSLVVAFARAGGGISPLEIAWIVVRMVALLRRGDSRSGRYFERIAAWADRLAVSQGLLAVVLVIALLYAWAAEFVGGVAAITGSYLAGVLFAQTRFKSADRCRHPPADLLDAGAGLLHQHRAARQRPRARRQVRFTVTAGARGHRDQSVGLRRCSHACSGFSTTESVRVGVGMISRGEVGLIVAGYGLANGLIGIDVFSAAVIMVLATTMVTPPLLRLTFPPAPPT